MAKVAIESEDMVYKITIICKKCFAWLIELSPLQSHLLIPCHCPNDCPLI